MSIEVVQTIRTYFQSHFSSRLLLLILITLPAVLLFLPGGANAGALWFWLLALLTIVALWVMIGRPAETDPAAAAPQLRAIHPGDEPESVRRIMAIDDATEDPSGVRAFRGTLNVDAEHALATLRNDLGPGAVPLIQPGRDGRTTVVLLPSAVEQQTMEFKVRPWLHWLVRADRGDHHVRRSCTSRGESAENTGPVCRRSSVLTGAA